MNSCLTNDIMIEAWAYNHTPEYKEHIRIRAYTEPKQGEMKNLHGMRRAKFRGLQKIRVQNYMSAIDISPNKKKTKNAYKSQFKSGSIKKF